MESIASLLRGIVESPLGTERVEQIAREVLRAVGDPKMHPGVAMRAARAVADGKLETQELTEMLDIIASQRKAGRLRSPGAYFVVSLKRSFQRNEIPW